MPFGEAEGHIEGNDKRELPANPAQSETPGMPGNSMHENRETPRVSGGKRPDRLEKATSYKTSMYARGESDERVVPGKYPNKGAVRPAEGMEGSRSTQGNTEENRTLRAQERDGVSQGLRRVREAAPNRGRASTPTPEVGAVCAKVRPYGSVRGAGSNPCPYRDYTPINPDFERGRGTEEGPRIQPRARMEQRRAVPVRNQRRASARRLKPTANRLP